jgi:hypothetical protein
MDNYRQLAKVIILQILKNLNIVRKADSYYYTTKLVYFDTEIDRSILITDDENAIFRLLGLDKEGLDDCICEQSTYDYLSKGRFYGKDFMDVIKISQTFPYFRKEVRSLWKICVARQYNNFVRVEDDVLYIKMIDRFCKSNVERQLKVEAAAKVRAKYIASTFSIERIGEWTRFKDAVSAGDVRMRFFDHIKGFYAGFNYPIEQYLSEVTLPQARKDLEAFIKEEDLAEFAKSNST